MKRRAAAVPGFIGTEPVFLNRDPPRERLDVLNRERPSPRTIEEAKRIAEQSQQKIGAVLYAGVLGGGSRALDDMKTSASVTCMLATSLQRVHEERSRQSRNAQGLDGLSRVLDWLCGQDYHVSAKQVLRELTQMADTATPDLPGQGVEIVAVTATEIQWQDGSDEIRTTSLSNLARRWSEARARAGVARAHRRRHPARRRARDLQ